MIHSIEVLSAEFHHDTGFNRSWAAGCCWYSAALTPPMCTLRGSLERSVWWLYCVLCNYSPLQPSFTDFRYNMLLKGRYGNQDQSSKTFALLFGGYFITNGSPNGTSITIPKNVISMLTPLMPINNNYYFIIVIQYILVLNIIISLLSLIVNNNKKI